MFKKKKEFFFVFCVLFVLFFVGWLIFCFTFIKLIDKYQKELQNKSKRILQNNNLFGDILPGHTYVSWVFFFFARFFLSNSASSSFFHHPLGHSAVFFFFRTCKHEIVKNKKIKKKKYRHLQVFFFYALFFENSCRRSIPFTTHSLVSFRTCKHEKEFVLKPLTPSYEGFYHVWAGGFVECPLLLNRIGICASFSLFFF